jgi:peptidoglycan/LPS O-acetylase OafA/YrhL
MNITQEIRSLTGIRGIAACYVVIYHYLALGAGSSTLGNFVKHGYLAVDLFFVLSGFVMAMNYGADFKEGFNINKYYSFLLKRLARVYPLYVVTTAVCLFLYLLDVESRSRLLEPSWQTLQSNVFLVQSWGIGASHNGPGWSISTELFAYLLFPGLTCALLFGRAQFAGCVIVVATFVLCALPILSLDLMQDEVRFGPMDIYNGSTVYPLLRCISEFMLGMIAWRLLHVQWVRHFAERGVAADILLATIVLLLMSQGNDIILIFLFVAFIMTLSAGRSISGAMLATRVPYGLGVISYSIYLVHRPILDHFEPRMAATFGEWQVLRPHLVSAAILLPCTILISFITFHFIEKPGRRWVQIMSGRRRDMAPGMAPRL